MVSLAGYIHFRPKLAFFGLFSIAVISISLTSCGVTSEPESIPNVKEKEAVGTNGRLISIQSENVRAAGYDANSMTMTVQFNNGYTYEYYGIQADLWDSFVAAQPNPWSLIGYPRLVEAGVPYRRIR